MKQWKKFCGIMGVSAAALATGFTVLAAQDSGMVTVEVKNVKGSALAVSYDIDGDEYYIPIGEPVQIPKGTILYCEPYQSSIEWSSELAEKNYRSIMTYVANVYAEEKNGTTELIYSSNDWMDMEPWEWTVEKDCTIIPEFTAVLDIWDEGVGAEAEQASNSKYYRINSKNVKIDSPSYVNVDINAYCNGKKISFSEVPSVKILKALNTKEPDYEALFELTETGIKSKEVLPLGHYRIPLEYCWSEKNGFRAETFIHIYVGKKAALTVNLAKGQYSFYDDTEEWALEAYSMKIPAETGESEIGYYDWRYGYCDASNTTTGTILERIEDLSGWYFNYALAGYEKTGTYMDESGKILSAGSQTLLKDATKGSTYEVFPVFKNGTKTFEPLNVQMFTEKDVTLAYYNSWKEENGSWYFYDEDGVLVKNQWAVKNGKPAFCGKDGALIVNGIAGISMEDEEGLWLVDADGAPVAGFTGTKTIGMTAYSVENGRVTGMETVKVATPSNAGKVEELADSLDMSMDTLTEEEKTEFADMLTAGIVTMNDSEKEKLEDSTLEKIDKLLSDIYGIEAEVAVTTNGEIEDENLLSGRVSAVGLLAASGINSAFEDTNIRLEITQKQTASASNADSLLLWFDAKLYVNDEVKQLRSPIIMEMELPESFRNYPKALYSFSGVHIKDSGAKTAFVPQISDDQKTMRIRTNSFSEFQILAKKKAVSSSHGSSSPTKKIKVNANAILDTSTGKNGQWVQDGDRWWFKYSDGTWPHSCWAELDWYGIRNWYYFDEAGYMVTGWKQDGGNTYYLHDVADGTRGRMYTGWNQIDSVWYYFSTVSEGPKGALLKNTTTPDGCQVGADGAWIQ